MTNRRGNRHRPLGARDRAKNRVKSRVRAKVEHVFHVLKRIFGFIKVRYRGIAKNGNQLFAACALANLHLKRRVLFRHAVV